MGKVIAFLPMFYTRTYVCFTNAIVSSLAAGLPINAWKYIFLQVGASLFRFLFCRGNHSTPTSCGWQWRRGRRQWWRGRRVPLAPAPSQACQCTEECPWPCTRNFIIGAWIITASVSWRQPQLKIRCLNNFRDVMDVQKLVGILSSMYQVLLTTSMINWTQPLLEAL